MPQIYLSYRRPDSALAGRIYDRLASRYGRDSVIMDLEAIALGHDYRDHIETIIRRSDLVVAIIGPNWLGKAGPRAKVHDQADPIRIEIEAALGSHIRLVPVLVGGAAMPHPSDLPATLQTLALLNALPLDGGPDFERDMHRLLHAIDGVLGMPTRAATAPAPLPRQLEPEAAARRRSGGGAIAAAATVVAAGAAGAAVVIAAPAAVVTVATGALIVGGGAALVAGSVAAVRQIGKVARRYRAAARLAQTTGASSKTPQTHVGTNEQSGQATEPLTAPRAREYQEETVPTSVTEIEADVDKEKQRLEEINWAAAASGSNPAALESFLASWPTGAHATAAAARIAELRAQQASRQDKDDVECSVFAPARPERGHTIVIQGLLHRTEQLAAAVKMAVERDASANRKGFAKLSTRIKRGTPVQFFLEVAALAIEKSLVEEIWTGSPVRAEFTAHVPAKAPLGPCQGTLHVMINGFTIGEIIFEINIEKERRRSGKLALAALGGKQAQIRNSRADPVATDVVSFNKAFVSYSRKDAQQVLLYAEALDDCGIKLLVDLTEIEPGEEWEPKLAELIGSAHVFYLMWSGNAAQSAWVERESRAAIAQYERSKEKRIPRIRPVIIDQGAPDPPDYLKRFHFTSRWQMLRTAQMHARRSLPTN